MSKDYNYVYIIYRLLTDLQGYIIMRTFTSDGLYKTYKVIKLYWHVSFYNNTIIVI